MLTVNGTEQHNDIVKPLYSVQAILIVSLAKWSRVQSTLSKMDTSGTSTKCPSYIESNKGSKENQGPTLGVRFTEVSVKRESTVHLKIIW